MLVGLSAHVGRGLQRRLCDRRLQLVDQSGEVDEVLAHHLLVIGNHALGDFRVTCLNDLGDGT